MSGGSCEAAPDCLETFLNASLAEPCASERKVCATRRAAHERLLLVVWLSLAGTSIFVMGLVMHAYRLTSPLGSPRSFAASGYTGIQFANPGIALASEYKDLARGRGDSEGLSPRAGDEERERELHAAEQSVLVD